MDYYFLSLAFSLLFPLSLAPLYFLLNRRTANSDQPNLPPGSFGWPVIGETLNFFSGDPESFIRTRLEKHSTPVFKTNLLGENTVVISGADANRLVATSENKLVKLWCPPSQRGLFGDKQLNKSPPGLARFYGLLKPRRKAVEKFDSLVKRQLSKYCQRGNVEVVGAYDLAKSSALILSCDYLLGMAPERAEARLAGRLDDIVGGIQAVHVAIPGTAFFRARRAAAAVRREILELMKEKAAEAAEGEDVLSVLVGGGEGGGKAMASASVASIVMGNMAASYGSIVTAIAFMVKFVGERPDVYDKIYSEQSEILASKGSNALNWNHINKMKYTWAVACETMRMVPPFLGSFREALTDFDYAGFTVPKGWKIFWAISVTNKNPEYFPDPEKFDPSRFMGKENLPYTFLPFGGGKRMCAGKEYARLAILTFMHNLVTKFKWDVLFPDEEVLGGMIMPTPVKGLPIRLHNLLSSFVTA